MEVKTKPENRETIFERFLNQKFDFAVKPHQLQHFFRLKGETWVNKKGVDDLNGAVIFFIFKTNKET